AEGQGEGPYAYSGEGRGPEAWYSGLSDFEGEGRVLYQTAESTGSGCDHCSGFRPDHSERDPGYARVRMPEYSCLSPAEIQRGGADPVRGDRRGKRVRRDADAYGNRTGYR